MSSFNAIRDAAFDKPSVTKYKSQLLFKELNYNLKILVQAIDGFRERCVEDAFREILMEAAAKSSLKLSQEENKKLQKTSIETLAAKEKDCAVLKKKIEDLNSIVLAEKAKEGEATSRIKELEKQIAVLEAQNMNKQIQKQVFWDSLCMK